MEWQSLHEWNPPEGTWALLWPGFYGPFTACWIGGEWAICEHTDLRDAIIGAVIDLPHLGTDAIPFVDRTEWDAE